MKKETLAKFAEAHKESKFKNKAIDYNNFVDNVFKLINNEFLKNSETYRIFKSFFDLKKYKEPLQMAIQFQAAIDFLMFEVNKEK